MESELEFENEEIKKLSAVLGVHERMFEIESKINMKENSVNIEVNFLYPN